MDTYPSSDARASCGAAVRTLVTWAAQLRDLTVPDALLERAAFVLADDLSAIVAARTQKEVVAFHDVVLAKTAAREATVFRGGRQRTDRCWAAVANGVAADWLELDEGYRKTPCHAGIYILPALLAEAEARNTRVDDLLRILVVAYELVTRIARGWRPRDLAMHAHSRYAAIGAAAAASLVRGYDSDTMLRAVTGACTLVSPGPRDHAVRGALIRNAWPAVGAWSGMLSAELAGCGIGGLPESPHDVFAVVLGGEPQASALTEGLGSQWAILDGYTKIHACCQQTHSAVEAVLALPLDGSEHNLNRIEEIIVETHPFAMPLQNYDPATTLASKFSLPHVVATAFVHRHAGAEAFAEAALTDPGISRLRRKVRLRPYLPLPAAPNDRPARIRVRLDDGHEITAHCLSAQGGPDRPFPREILVSKIRELTTAAYPGLLPALMQIAALSPHWLARTWGDVVTEICGAPASEDAAAARRS